MHISRRKALSILGSTLAISKWSSLLKADEKNKEQIGHIATNTYPWLTFARREKTPFSLSDSLRGEISKAGLQGYEPIVNHPDELKTLARSLKKHRLEMKSIYVNSVLHEVSKSKKSIEAVLKIALEAKKLGTRIIVTNPSPIRWGGDEDKSDSQLRHQAFALEHLGKELKKNNLVLAYHNHDAELRQGGREFHHMLTSTDPIYVKFCLDSHWIFRGCGNSEVALFDAVKNYSERIVELHLRQSKKGIWTESFSMDGDINYVNLFKFLKMKNIIPHLVLEQAVEKASPKTLTATEAHKIGRDNLFKFLSQKKSKG